MKPKLSEQQTRQIADFIYHDFRENRVEADPIANEEDSNKSVQRDTEQEHPKGADSSR